MNRLDVFSQLCNVLDPDIAVSSSSVSNAPLSAGVPSPHRLWALANDSAAAGAGRSNVEASRAAKASGYRVAGAGAKGPSCWLGFAGQRARAFQAGLHGQARLGPRPPQVRRA